MTNEQAKAIRLSEQDVADMMHPELLTDIGYREMLNGEEIEVGLPWLTRFANFIRSTSATAAPIAAGVVPEGFKLVPVAPTEEMIRAAAAQMFSPHISHVIKAAVGAAPTNPVPVASGTVLAKPVAWMNPNEGCVMDAFIWQRDHASPRYSVPVYAGAPASPAVAIDELHFNAKRLRNVVKLVGLPDPFPDDDEALDGARGSMLGQIAGVLRTRATAAPIAAGVVPEGPSAGQKAYNRLYATMYGAFCRVDDGKPAKHIEEAVRRLYLMAEWGVVRAALDAASPASPAVATKEQA